MRVFLFLAIVFVTAFPSGAQVSGYMGKRMVISYSNYFMIGLKGPGPISSGSMAEFSPTINNTNCLNLEYAYSMRNMICLSGQYMRTGIAYDKGNRDGFLISSNERPYPESTRYGGKFSKPALLTSFNFGLSLKSFARGFIAPMGKYKKIELLMMFEKVKYDHKNFLKEDNSGGYPYTETQYTLGKGEYKYTNVSIAYTMGRQRVVNDRFVIDYGVRIAYAPTVNAISILAGDDFVDTIEDYYRRASRMRVFRHQLINFHLGIGFLAF
ncbi:MAG: hypothetical protein M3R27_09700 [Bacteroidota bacterium]|nr:hypothetical protein [Bacteroidota bacterium]